MPPRPSRGRVYPRVHPEARIRNLDHLLTGPRDVVRRTTRQRSYPRGTPGSDGKSAAMSQTPSVRTFCVRSEYCPRHLYQGANGRPPSYPFSGRVRFQCNRNSTNIYAVYSATSLLSWSGYIKPARTTKLRRWWIRSGEDSSGQIHTKKQLCWFSDTSRSTSELVFGPRQLLTEQRAATGNILAQAICSILSLIGKPNHAIRGTAYLQVSKVAIGR